MPENLPYEALFVLKTQASDRAIRSGTVGGSNYKASVDAIDFLLKSTNSNKQATTVC